MRMWRFARYLLPTSLLAAGGCLGALERGIDLVLSPGAVENALVLPYTGLVGLTQLLQRLL